MFDINTFDVVKYDEILSRGLSSGLGNPESSMCIEAAICATLGLEHGDDPECVASSVRSFKIKLNDCKWSNPQERAKGLRDLGLAQLGSLNVINDIEFVKYLSEDIIGILLPTLIYDIFPDNIILKNLVDICKKEKSKQSALNLRSAAYVAAAAASYATDAAGYAIGAAASATASATASSYAASAAASSYAAACSYTAACSYAASAAASAAAGAGYAAGYAANKYLNLAAKIALDILIEMKSPGIKLLGFYLD